MEHITVKPDIAKRKLLFIRIFLREKHILRIMETRIIVLQLNNLYLLRYIHNHIKWILQRANNAFRRCREKLLSNNYFKDSETKWQQRRLSVILMVSSTSFRQLTNPERTLDAWFHCTCINTTRSLKISKLSENAGAQREHWQSMFQHWKSNIETEKSPINRQRSKDPESIEAKKSSASISSALNKYAFVKLTAQLVTRK